jgi:hypothetical protein
MFDPIDGGATPIMVPLSFGFGAATTGAAAGGPAGAATGGAAAGGAAGAGAAGFPGVGAFIISMVPLNLGEATAAFSAKPHLAQAVAVS